MYTSKPTNRQIIIWYPCVRWVVEKSIGDVARVEIPAGNPQFDSMMIDCALWSCWVSVYTSKQIFTPCSIPQPDGWLALYYIPRYNKRSIKNRNKERSDCNLASAFRYYFFIAWSGALFFINKTALQISISFCPCLLLFLYFVMQKYQLWYPQYFLY